MELQAIPHDIPLRRLDLPFEPDEVPRDFYLDDPSLTLVMAAFSLVFPEGERFFVESVVRFKERIADPALAARVRGFAAQEAMHAKEHTALNRMIEAQGLEAMASLERDVKALLSRARRLRTPEEQIAITAALEHITAIMGEQLLGDRSYRHAIHETVRPLLLWHALEELEHKDVAFDVFEKVSGSYRKRVGALAIATFGFVVFIARAHFQMLRERGMEKDLRVHARTFAHLWIAPGIFRTLIPVWAEYFRPGFHPSHRDTKGLVATWREKLFGEGGLLRRELDRGRRPEQGRPS